jgi:hypothetical protein
MSIPKYIYITHPKELILFLTIIHLFIKNGTVNISMIPSINNKLNFTVDISSDGGVKKPIVNPPIHPKIPIQ